MPPVTRLADRGHAPGALSIRLIEQPSKPLVERAGNGACGVNILSVERDHEPPIFALKARVLDGAQRRGFSRHVPPEDSFFLFSARGWSALSQAMSTQRVWYQPLAT